MQVGICLKNCQRAKGIFHELLKEALCEHVQFQVVDASAVGHQQKAVDVVGIYLEFIP